jgi:hypothetical protein
MQSIHDELLIRENRAINLLVWSSIGACVAYFIGYFIMEYISNETFKLDTFVHFLLGAPTAYIIWLWRDQNTQLSETQKYYELHMNSLSNSYTILNNNDIKLSRKILHIDILEKLISSPTTNNDIKELSATSLVQLSEKFFCLEFKRRYRGDSPVYVQPGENTRFRSEFTYSDGKFVTKLSEALFKCFAAEPELFSGFLTINKEWDEEIHFHKIDIASDKTVFLELYSFILSECNFSTPKMCIYLNFCDFSLCSITGGRIDICVSKISETHFRNTTICLDCSSSFSKVTFEDCTLMFLGDDVPHKFKLEGKYFTNYLNMEAYQLALSEEPCDYQKLIKQITNQHLFKDNS